MIDTVMGCVFCNDFRDRGGVLWADEEVALVLDASPIAEYHMLVVPKRHVTAFSVDHPNKRACLGGIIEHLSKAIGDVVVFENGLFDARVGVGTTHAHVHLASIPHDFDLCDLLMRVIVSFRQQCVIVMWWPEEKYKEQWKAYTVFYIPKLKRAVTVYFNSQGDRQIGRRTVAWLNHKSNYRYDMIGINGRAIKRKTEGLRHSLKLEALRTEAPYTLTIEGASGTGKTTVAKILAERRNGIVVHSGAVFCSVANYLWQNELKGTVETVNRALDCIDAHILTEENLSPEVRERAAHLASDQVIWLQVMNRIQERVVSANRYVQCVVVEGHFLRRIEWERSLAVVLKCSEEERQVRIRFRNRSLYNEEHLELARFARDQLRYEARDSAANCFIDTSRRSPEQVVDQIEALI
jgi:diadenosine tetraphosphate (Ap4A) HIT family hydrolase/broad-specificity NMP kinase